MNRAAQVAELLAGLAGEDPGAVASILREFDTRDVAAALVAAGGGGGGGSQPIRLLGPYTLTVATVIANWDVNHAIVPIGFTPTVGDFILDVLVICTIDFDEFAGFDSGPDGLKSGDQPLAQSSFTLATQGGDLIGDWQGSNGTISTRNYDTVQGSTVPIPALVVSAEPVTAWITSLEGNAPTVGSADFYFLVMTPTAP